jgi:hypothetical protein
MRWNSRVWIRALVICCALVLAVGFAIPAIPPNVRRECESLFCEKCGVCKWVTQIKNPNTGAVIDSESEISPTALSAWYEAHYPSPCEHLWQKYHGSVRSYFVLGRFRLRTGSGGSGGRLRPALLSLNEDQRKELDEKYAADKAACQQYIAAALK